MFVTSRRLWWGLVVLVVLLVALGALVPVVANGVPASPLITTLALPPVRFVRDIAATLTVGCVVVGGLVVPDRSARVLGWSTGWAVVWLVAVVAQAVLTLSDVLAASIPEALDPSTMWSFLSSVTLGRVFLWQAVAAALVLLLGRAVISAPTAWVVVLIAAAGASLPGLVGHGGLSHGHVAATLSLAAHLLAVSLWLGGLAAVVAYVRIEPDRAAAVLPRFSMMALGSVILVAESGLLNASLRLSYPGSLLGSDYGALMLVKATLLLWLVLLAWQQRSTVLPSLPEGGPVTLAWLARLAGWEFLAMGAAVAVGVTMAWIGPDSTTPSPYTINPLSVAMLAAAVPAALTRAVHPSAEHRWSRWAQQYPEAAAVALAVVVIETAGVTLPSLLLGPDVGALVSATLLLVAGWWAAVALHGQRATLGRAAMVIAWVVSTATVLWFERSRVNGDVSLRLSLLSLAIAVGCVLLVRPSRPAAPAFDDTPAEAVRG